MPGGVWAFCTVAYMYDDCHVTPAQGAPATHCVDSVTLFRRTRKCHAAVPIGAVAWICALPVDRVAPGDPVADRFDVVVGPVDAEGDLPEAHLPVPVGVLGQVTAEQIGLDPERPLDLVGIAADGGAALL